MPKEAPTVSKKVSDIAAIFGGVKARKTKRRKKRQRSSKSCTNKSDFMLHHKSKTISSTQSKANQTKKNKINNNNKKKTKRRKKGKSKSINFVQSQIEQINHQTHSKKKSATNNMIKLDKIKLNNYTSNESMSRSVTSSSPIKENAMFLSSTLSNSPRSPVPISESMTNLISPKSLTKCSSNLSNYSHKEEEDTQPTHAPQKVVVHDTQTENSNTYVNGNEQEELEQEDEDNKSVSYCYADEEDEEDGDYYTNEQHNAELDQLTGIWLPALSSSISDGQVTATEHALKQHDEDEDSDDDEDEHQEQEKKRRIPRKTSSSSNSNAKWRPNEIVTTHHHHQKSMHSLPTPVQYMEYFGMSPIETPPQPTEIVVAQSFHSYHNYYFRDSGGVINENQFDDEDSLSLNDENDDEEKQKHVQQQQQQQQQQQRDERGLIAPHWTSSSSDNDMEIKDEELNMTTMEQLLSDYGIERTSHGDVYEYFWYELGIKYAYQLSQFTPQQILSADLVQIMHDEESQRAMMQILLFVAYKIITKCWFSDKLRDWTEFEYEQKRKHVQKNKQKKKKNMAVNQVQIVKASIGDEAYWLFDGESNKIKMNGKRCKYLSKEIGINETWKMLVKIESYSKCGISPSNRNVFIIGIELPDVNETLSINDKFEVYGNDVFLKCVAGHRLTDGAEIFVNIDNRWNSPTISFKADDVQNVYHHFDVDSKSNPKLKTNSRIKVFIKQYYGECVYGIYPARNN